MVRDDTLLEKLKYIHDNPVRRGLVHHPGDWRWSSHRYHEGGDESLIAMDWDGSIPVVS